MPPSLLPPNSRRAAHARGGLGRLRRRRGTGLGRPQSDERPPRPSQLACAIHSAVHSAVHSALHGALRGALHRALCCDPHSLRALRRLTSPAATLTPTLTPHAHPHPQPQRPPGGSLLGATPGHRLIAKAGEVLAGVLDGGGPHARACAAAAPESRPDGGGVYGCILARALEITCAPCALFAPSLHSAAPCTPLPDRPPTHPPACSSPSPSPASSFLTLTPVCRRPARAPPAARTAAALQLPTRAAAVPAGGLRHRRARARGAHTNALSVHERSVPARADRAALARADLLFEDGGRGLITSVARLGHLINTPN